MRFSRRPTLYQSLLPTATLTIMSSSRPIAEVLDSVLIALSLLTFKNGLYYLLSYPEEAASMRPSDDPALVVSSAELF